MQSLVTAAALFCLLSASVTGARANTYHCNPDNRPLTINSSADSDFRLVTRLPHSPGYSFNLVCEFNVQLGDDQVDNKTGGAYFVEIESFKVRTAVLTVSSAGQVLLRVSSLASHQSSLSTHAGQLTVRFDATNDYSNLEGVRIRVRTFDSNGCPPDWTFLAGRCFGTSDTTSSLTFADAQKACNSMRANLLQLPAAYFNSVAAFVKRLPPSLSRGYVWVGLTDLTDLGQFRHFWLNGRRQHQTSEISCYFSASHFTTCRADERCGTFYEGGRAVYAIYMDRCLDKNRFACSMPPGGARRYFTVPSSSGGGSGGASHSGSSSIRRAWMWGGIGVGFLLICVAIVSVHSLLRTGSRRRTGSSSSGGVGGSNPVCRYPEPPPLPPLSLRPVDLSTTLSVQSPPSYDAAMAEAAEARGAGALGGGHCNPRFDK